MTRNHSKSGRSQLLKGKKGAQRKKAGSKPTAPRQRILAARRRKVNEREARDAARERKAAMTAAKQAENA
jgi:hypothetical protein